MDDDASTPEDDPEATTEAESTAGSEATTEPEEPTEPADGEGMGDEDGDAESGRTGPGDDPEGDADRPGTAAAGTAAARTAAAADVADPGEAPDEDTVDVEATAREETAAGEDEVPGEGAVDAETVDDDASGEDGTPDDPADQPAPKVPEDVRTYDRFTKMDGAQYDRVNEFLRARTYVTAREWAMARLCADFRTETGVEMTKIGENLPELVPFMTDTYSPQAVNQARSSFEEKVRKAGATFLYGAMSDFFTADELDDLMYEVTEVAKFLLEVEGVDLSVEEELDAEERISSVMRDVRASSHALRHDGVECPNCGHEIDAGE